MTDENLLELIGPEDLAKRVAEMGAQITEKFKNEKLIAVCVLKGSFIFYSDLIRNINTDIKCDFFGCSSYGNETSSSGEVKLTLDLTHPIVGQNILLVEDIVDSGITMNYLIKNLQARKPKSITTATLLYKPNSIKEKCQLDYVGFEIGDEFVVGYGLDYQGYYRNIPYIAQLNSIN